ncbi:MAG: HAMP domain-containing protein [Planctomycetes bacterium]|nr:HAMP domain-containing protein [Planctomycetota bacterium]
MSIRWKIIAVLGVVTILYAGIDHLSLRFLFAKQSEHIGRERAEEDLQQVLSSLEGEKQELAELAAAWADWLASAGSDALGDSLGTQLMVGCNVHVLYLCAADGRVLHHRVLDPETGSEIQLRQLPGHALGVNHPALAWFDGQPERRSLAATDKGILALASRRTAEELPGGTLILGRFLDSACLARVAERQGVRLELLAGDWAAQGADPAIVEASARSEGGVVFGAATAEALSVGRTLVDWEGRDTLLLEVESPRRSDSRDAKFKGYVLLSSLATALILTFVLMRLLERVVVRPLGLLTHHTVEVGKGNSAVAPLDLASQDELGTLAREFGRMLERLEVLRREASNASRQAGMSEVATCVLHNVGNALNSATVAAGLVRSGAQALAVDDLVQLAEVLEHEAHDLPGFLASEGRDRKLVAFARELGDGLSSQRRGLLMELSRLDETIQRIVLLITTQQSLAGGRGFPERVSLAAQLDEVVELTRSAASSGVVEWRREYEDVPETVTDRHRLVEILLVLIRNARQAVEESGRADGSVTLRIRRSGERRVCVEVEDNGAGIAPENLTRIFAGGFTTKKTGLGYSLHHACNAATELGGTLSGESAGPGAGACFRLEVPLVQVPTALRPASARASMESPVPV